jgi:hypothetical protein
MSDNEQGPDEGREDSTSKKRTVEEATRDPESVRGSGAPASGNPGVGEDVGKYEE